MGRLSLLLFGSVRLVCDEKPITSLGSRTLALLAYLAIEADRPHRREALAALLWPDLPDAHSRNNLRQALFQLHQALGEGDPPFLIADSQTVQLNRSSAALDVAEFQALVETCRQHLHHRPATCPTCVERLERAASLYQGDLLADFSLKDGAAYEEWVMVWRERLRRLALNVLHTLANHYGLCGDYARMEQAARQQIEIDPFYEKAHRQLLKALAWSGQANDALGHYAALSQALAQELDTPPESATTALCAQIRAGTLLPPAPSPLHNWPGLLSPLIGRAAELAALADLLQHADTRLVTIVGAGGVGKTRLALAVAAHEALAFADGACFVPLAGVAAPVFIVPAIAAALGLTLAGPGNPLARLCARLCERELLLLLDNMEHLLAGVTLVADLLAACPGLQVLATSREPLHLHAEQLYPLLPLGLPDWAQLPANEEARAAEVAKAPAVALFFLRAQAAQPDFRLDAGNATTIGEICTRLDGLPLAIELAAAHMRTLSLGEMLTLLDNRLALLVDGFRDLPPRQRTLRATLDWSYGLLSAGEQQLLARLAVFADGCTPQVAQEVCGVEAAALAAGLQALVDKGLLQHRDGASGAPWYSMLETVHEYARERLEESGEQAGLREQHARYCVALAEEAESPSSNPEVMPWVARLGEERSNLRAALQWALEQGEQEVALRLSGALWMFWDAWGDYVEGSRWLEAALKMPPSGEPPAKDAGSDTLAKARARALTGAGVLAVELGDWERAAARLEESLAISRRLNDVKMQATVLAWLGWAAGEMGDHSRASACYGESLALNRQRGGRAGGVSVAFVLNGLGNLAVCQEDFAAARAYYEESLALRRELGDDYGVICSLANLGFVVYHDGDLVQAGRLFRESLALAGDLQSRMDIALGMLGLAVVALAEGQGERAVRLLGQVDCFLRSSGITLSSSDRALYENSLAEARARLGPEASEVAWAQGQAVPLKQAVQEALHQE
jgi:predicted ATPase/DNA-binding SARP family transcriptional activator